MFRKEYAEVFRGYGRMEPIQAESSDTTASWQSRITYIRLSPSLLMNAGPACASQDIHGARIPAMLGIR